MPRSKGSLSSKQAKEIANELSVLLDTSQKYNLDVLRAIVLLISQRIAEQVADYPEETPLTDMVTSVEIPLIGTLKITPSVFHESHGMTSKPSYHFEYEFSPTSSFKMDVSKAYTQHQTDIPDILTDEYVDRLIELYRKLRET